VRSFSVQGRGVDKLASFSMHDYCDAINAMDRKRSGEDQLLPGAAKHQRLHRPQMRGQQHTDGRCLGITLSLCWQGARGGARGHRRRGPAGGDLPAHLRQRVGGGGCRGGRRRRSPQASRKGCGRQPPSSGAWRGATTFVIPGATEGRQSTRLSRACLTDRRQPTQKVSRTVSIQDVCNKLYRHRIALQRA